MARTGNSDEMNDCDVNIFMESIATNKMIATPSTSATTCASTRKENRGTWSRELDFVLACVGYAIGLGNIWRFPYLCYKNGGGAFLIPYFLSIITCGIPIFLLEIAFGQYMKLGSIGAWKIAPAFKGIGVASFIIVFSLNVYYIVVLAWALFYLYMSMTSTLPWSHCDNDWNTDRCFVKGRAKSVNFTIADGTSYSTVANGTSSIVLNGSMVYQYTANATDRVVDSVVEFWETSYRQEASMASNRSPGLKGITFKRRVLKISNGIDEPGSLQWELVLALCVAWVLVFFGVWRGVKWSGKVVYFTALFPYVILVCLFVRGVTLEGAAEGIKFYLKPDFSRLADPQVWVDGGTQIFFSYGVALGCLTTLGSYNRFNNNFYRDCCIVSCVNTATSLFGGFVVFSVLGFMAHEQNVTVAEVADAGPGLVFIAYPKAVTKMPVSTLWSILFFLMILLVGLDSEFVASEGLLTPILDQFPSRLYKMRNRVLVTLAYCTVSFMIGLCMVTQGGVYIFQLFDYYSASGFVLLWVCFFEAVVIAWVFGSERFMDAVELMIGRRIPYWFVICWKFISPALIICIFVFSLVSFKPVKYNNVYEYPLVAQVLGVCLALLSMVCIPLVFCVKFLRYPGGVRKKWELSTTPILTMNQIPDHWDKRTINTDNTVQ